MLVLGIDCGTQHHNFILAHLITGSVPLGRSWYGIGTLSLVSTNTFQCSGTELMLDQCLQDSTSTCPSYDMNVASVSCYREFLGLINPRSRRGQRVIVFRLLYLGYAAA